MNCQNVHHPITTYAVQTHLLLQFIHRGNGRASARVFTPRYSRAITARITHVVPPRYSRATTAGWCFRFPLQTRPGRGASHKKLSSAGPKSIVADKPFGSTGRFLACFRNCTCAFLWASSGRSPWVRLWRRRIHTSSWCAAKGPEVQYENNTNGKNENIGTTTRTWILFEIQGTLGFRFAKRPIT